MPLTLRNIIPVNLRSLLIISVIFSQLQTMAQMPDLIPFLENNKYGYSDRTGKIVIAPKYDRAVFFDGRSALVEIREKKALRQVIINKKGEVTFANPDNKVLEMVPGGQYFTTTFHSPKKDTLQVSLFNTSGVQLKTFEGSPVLKINFVLDSVVFYSDSRKKGEPDSLTYFAYDLSGSRKLAFPHKHILLNDSQVLFQRAQNDYYIMRLKDHQFVKETLFSDYILTNCAKGFVVVKEPKSPQYGIIRLDGKPVIPVIYKQVEWKIVGKAADLSENEKFVCTPFNGPRNNYKVQGNELVLSNSSLNSKIRYRVIYSKAKKAFTIHFHNGAITDTIFTPTISNRDTFNHFIMGELKQGSGKMVHSKFRLIDTLGHSVLDSFSGIYCGKGLYLIQGPNGRYAFWNGKKYISPYIYSQDIHNVGNFTTPPPVYTADGNCLITNVLNNGNNAFGLMDINGRDILNPIYHYIKPVGNGLYFVTGNKGMFYCSASGVIYAASW